MNLEKFPDSNTLLHKTILGIKACHCQENQVEIVEFFMKLRGINPTPEHKCQVQNGHPNESHSFIALFVSNPMMFSQVFIC